MKSTHLVATGFVAWQPAGAAAGIGSRPGEEVPRRHTGVSPTSALLTTAAYRPTSSVAGIRIARSHELWTLPPARVTMSVGKDRILVIDDNCDIIAIVTRVLRRQGYECWGAASGRAGLQILQNKRVDLILLDVRMPEMDGLEVCARLRKDPELRQVPIILLTCLDDYNTRARAMVLGVSEYMTKPIIQRRLLSSVESQLHSARLCHELGRTQATVESHLAVAAQRPSNCAGY